MRESITATFVFFTIILFLILVSAVSFETYRYFAPKYAEVDNSVFHESSQYTDGMIRDLENLQIQYESASSDQKAALRSVVIHRFSIFPQEKLPLNLRIFYNQLKGGVL